MKLTSVAFKQNGKIPAKYTCQGLDINPPLEISDVPTDAKSLVLIVDDPDVPERVRKDRMWVHWIAFNIDPKTEHIKEGIHSLGIFGSNTNGEAKYMGPCPPDREHRYFFKLYALNTSLQLPQGTQKEELLHSLEGHILTQCELIGRYEKS